MNREADYCYYKAMICVNLLLQNNLIEEVDFKQYKITKKGKELIRYCYLKNITEINIPTICDKFKKAKYYDYTYLPRYARTIEEVTKGIAKKIVKKKKEEEKNNLGENFNINNKISIEERVANLREIEYKEKAKEKISTQKKEQLPVRINFKKVNEAKIDFGKECEQIIYEYEIQKLMQEGRQDKAKEVLWVSKEKGDGAGYDIESFENQNGLYKKIYIEVKGTNKNCTEPFEVTLNEIEISEKNKNNYYIYRLGKANTKKIEFYKIKGSIAENFDLTAISFKAQKKKK